MSPSRPRSANDHPQSNCFLYLKFKLYERHRIFRQIIHNIWSMTLESSSRTPKPSCNGKNLTISSSNQRNKKLNARTKLQAVLSHPPKSAIGKSDWETSLLQIGEELSLMSKTIEQLHEASACITRVRNRSNKLVPISMFPPKLLSYIFPSHL